MFDIISKLEPIILPLILLFLLYLQFDSYYFDRQNFLIMNMKDSLTWGVISLFVLIRCIKLFIKNDDE